jgi:surfactin synthase thioesterase subunit
VEVWPVQFPGRETRADEPNAEDWREVVFPLAEAIRPLLDRPYAFYGHSMGGMIAFELTRQLRRLGAPPPLRLVLAAVMPLHLIPERFLAQVEELPDAAFLQTMSERYGSPMTVLGDPQARERALPVLRADVRLVNRYRCLSEPPLEVPISAYAGAQDREVPPEKVGHWREHTTRDFRTRAFEGGHFFLFPRREEVIRAVLEDLGLTPPAP